NISSPLPPSYTLPEGGTVRLDASGSSSPNGQITQYDWDLNYNGTTFSPTLTGDTISFSAVGLDGPSNRTVALRITDTAGQSAIFTSLIYIVDAAPDATVVVPMPVVGQPVPISFANSDD